MPPSGTDFFVNVRILNKESIVEDKVRERLGRNPFTRAAERIANDFVSVDEVARKVGERMAEHMPGELRGQGIGARCRLRFQRGPLLVLSVGVVSADLARLAEVGALPGVVACLPQCFEFLPGSLHRRLYATALKRLAGVLISRVTARATSDLEASGVCAEVTALSLAEETEFLLSEIESIDNEAKAKSRPQRRRAVQDLGGRRCCKGAEAPGARGAAQPCQQPARREAAVPVAAHFLGGGPGRADRHGWR